MDCDGGPSRLANSAGSVRTLQASGAMLETARTPQPQNSFYWHHLGGTAGGEMFGWFMYAR